jgi:O-antigen/teichoic acid export membrane protein
MAPIWGSVAGSLALALLLIGFCKRKNILRFSVSEYRDVLHFSLYSGGVSIINVLYNLAPQLFLVRILDFAAAGLYSNAISITKVFDRLIGQVLGPVIMPAIASRNRVGGDMKRIYLDAMALLSAVHWPFLAFLAIMAQPIVSLWLGPAWLEVVPLARMLCIGSLSLFVASLTYPTLVAIGSVRDALIASAISLPPSLLVTLVASFMGVQAVAASAMLTLPFQASVAIYFIGRHLNISLREILHATYKSGLVALCSSAATAVCATMAEYGLIQQVWGLALGCLFASMCWLFMVVVTEHPILPRLQLSGIGLWRLLPAPASREARLIRITPE